MQNSKSNVVRSDRPTTVLLWLIALLAVLIGGALWLLFPKADLERQLANTQDDSELSLNYLTNLLESDPDNEHLLSLLKAKQRRQIEIKRAAEVASTQLLPDASAAAWSHWGGLYSRYQEVEKYSSKSTRQIEQLRLEVLGAIRAIPRQGLSKEQTFYLASSSLALRDIPLAMSLYQELASISPDTEQKSKVYADASRQLLGFSRYEEASQLLQSASKATQDPRQARSYLLEAMRVLQSANRAKDAMALAESNAETLGNDPETLRTLIDLARAAGKPAAAEKYVKQLLKITLLQQWNAQQTIAIAQNDNSRQVFDDGAWSLQSAMWQGAGWSMQHTAATSSIKSPPGTPALPFDDKTYQLGYDVFLENRNLENAWHVAQAAVKQAPQDIAWRERLAKVSEWLGRPQVALDNWLFIAQTTQREDAWQAVMRLAPGLFDDRALIAGIKHQLSQRPNDHALLRSLIQTYERQGNPQLAIDYLQHHAPSPQTLEALAQLAQRAGQNKLALATWKRLLQDPEQRIPANVMPAAAIALLEGEPDLGLKWLEDAQSRVPKKMIDEADYWRFMGSLALQQRDERVATQAYRKLLSAQNADVSDYDALINVMLRNNRDEAAQLSLRAWEKFHDLRHLTQAFYLLEDKEDWSQLGKQLEQALATPEIAERLQKQAAFFHVLGMYYERTNRAVQARDAFLSGLALTPDSVQLRQALLWLLIDTRDATSLKSLLARVESSWAQDSSMHNALAAANQSLSRPTVALQRYLQPHRADNSDDFLWMMSYADALEQDQQADLAWRLRRELWLQQLQRTPAPKGKNPTREWLTPEGLSKVQQQARSRLLLNQSHGDDELTLMRELLRQDLVSSNRKEYSAAATELAIAWLQDRGEYAAERGYLWQQYARSRSKQANAPLWAQITTALAEKDTAEVGALLERHGENLPRNEYMNAAVMVGDLRLAQSAGFEVLVDQPNSDEAHTSLTEQLLAVSHFAEYGITQRHLNGINETAQSLRWHQPINSRWALEVEGDHVRRSVNNSDFVQRPSSERGVGLQLRRVTQFASTDFLLGERRSLATYHPLQVTHSQSFGNRWTIQGSLGKNLSMQDTLAMRMGGMKDRVSTGATYQFSRQDRVGLEFAAERYFVQGGARVGSGQHTTLQYTHTYRSEAPTIEFGAFTSWHSYSRTDPATLTGRDSNILRYLPIGSTAGMDYLLPNNFRFSGIQVSTNMRYSQEYTRALRPFASLALTNHSVSGSGYEVRLGFAGSVLGADHLMVGLNLSKSGLNNTGTTRELQLIYRLHY
ncbi:tetratricopeptide repeat protein [Comamonas aquatilis]|uniref:tetratricopeptide repeat protein n=1 Tax=Comamonas aquatilis TaxID=1778406 RepID=UPI0039EE0D85